MKKQNIVIGVAPTKRSFLSMEEAKRQKEKFMAVIRGIHPDVVTLVDIDCLLYTSPSPRDMRRSRMPSSA